MSQRMAVSVGDRITFEGIPGSVVGRIDRNFVEIELDRPRAAVNVKGEPYESTSWCAHVSTVIPDGALF